MAANSSTKKVVYAALAGNLLVAITKGRSGCLDGEFGHAERDGPLVRRYPKRTPAPSWIPPRRPTSRYRASSRIWSRDLLLELYCRAYDFCSRFGFRSTRVSPMSGVLNRFG